MTLRERREMLGDRAILGIALDLHSGMTGGLERSMEDMRNDVMLLKAVLKTWQESYRDAWAAFDDAVRHLVVCVLAEAGLYAGGALIADRATMA